MASPQARQLQCEIADIVNFVSESLCEITPTPLKQAEQSWFVLPSEDSPKHCRQVEGQEEFHPWAHIRHTFYAQNCQRVVLILYKTPFPRVNHSSSNVVECREL